PGVTRRRGVPVTSSASRGQSLRLAISRLGHSVHIQRFIMSAVRQFARHRLGLFSAIFAVAGLAALISAEGLWAQSSGPDVYRIEEDWQLVVNEPDADENGPQVTCTISPLDMGTAYCALDLNYHTQPDYVAGGLQIHTWDPLDPIEYANSIHTQIMQTSGE